MISGWNELKEGENRKVRRRGPVCKGHDRMAAGNIAVLKVLDQRKWKGAATPERWSLL